MSASDKNYLELCQDLVREAGISGASTLPTSAVGQTGELRRVVDWVAQADMHVQNMFMDWNFLIKTATFNLKTGGVKGTDDIYSLTDIGIVGLHRYWKKDSFFFKPDADDYKFIEFHPWRYARRNWNLGASKSRSPPDRFSVMPDRSIVIDSLPVDADPVTLEYGVSVTRMSANDSISPIPAHLRQIIVWKAMQYYAAYEDAPELMDGPDGAMAQYQEYRRQLMAEELPNREHQGVSETSDEDALTIQVL